VALAFANDGPRLIECAIDPDGCAVLSHIRERQIERAEARSQSAPRRQGQVGHMFKVG
jgi:hypothetical protein